MLRYEYKVWYAGGRASELELALNQEGRAGWHIQHVIPADGDTPAMLVLARPHYVSTDPPGIPDDEEVRK